MRGVGLPAGIYQHYKGHHYLVLGQAQDANDDDRVVVVYVGLETPGAKNPLRMSIRSLDDFISYVDPETGDIVDPDDLDTPARPRFAYVGPGMDLSAVNS